MPTIKYTFVDGTTSEIEVTEEIYALHEQLATEEKRNDKRETRRHISLNYLNERGIEFESKAADPLSALIRREDEARIHSAISKLSDKQRALLEKVFYRKMSLREIERQTGVCFQPVFQQQSGR